MKTQEKTLKRVVMPLLACALAVGLLPANVIAFAQENAAQIINETVSLNADQSSNGSASAESGNASSVDAAASDAAASTSDPVAADQDAAVQADATGDAQVSTSDSASSVGASSSANMAAATSVTGGYTTSSIERISADVPVDAASTTVVGNVEYEGLTYRINTDGATATLVGLGSTAPKGDIVIPAQIASGNQLYTVTNIRSTQKLGGGDRPF